MQVRFVLALCLTSVVIITTPRDSLAQSQFTGITEKPSPPLHVATARPEAIADSLSAWPAPPLALSADPFTVIISTPLSRSWLVLHDDAPMATAYCRSIVSHAITEPRALRPPPPPTSWSSINSERQLNAPLITITVTPVLGSPAQICGPGGIRGPGMVDRGLAYMNSYTYHPYHDVQDARLVAFDSLPVAPVSYTRLPISIYLRAGAPSPRDTASQVRLSVPPEHFAPDTDGRFPPLTAIIHGVGSPPTRLVLPESAVRRVWYDFLEARLTGTGTAGAIAALPPAPVVDPVVRASARLYDTGDPRAAAIALNRQLAGGSLSPDDSLHARVLLALSLLSLGDTLDAAPLASALVREDPCFSLPSALVPPSWHRVSEEARGSGGTRCWHSVPLVTGAALLVPGLGQIITAQGKERRVFGVGLTVLTVATLAIAKSEYSKSERSYDHYLVAPDAERATILYNAATRSRARARNVATIGAAVWAIGAVEAFFHELSHSRHMRRVQYYGSRPFVASDGRRVSLGLSFAPGGNE